MNSKIEFLESQSATWKNILSSCDETVVKVVVEYLWDNIDNDNDTMSNPFFLLRERTYIHARNKSIDFL